MESAVARRCFAVVVRRVSVIRARSRSSEELRLGEFSAAGCSLHPSPTRLCSLSCLRHLMHSRNPISVVCLFKKMPAGQSMCCSLTFIHIYIGRIGTNPSSPFVPLKTDADDKNLLRFADKHCKSFIENNVGLRLEILRCRYFQKNRLQGTRTISPLLRNRIDTNYG
jgi:hypothetical protein